MDFLFGTSAGRPAGSLAAGVTMSAMTTERDGHSRLVAATQGASYLGFAASLFARPRQYRDRHGIETSDWVPRAHGTWMAVTGATLLTAAICGRASQAEVRMLGLGSAAGLAANDALGAARRDIAPIYISDLAWESAVGALWLMAIRRGARKPSAPLNRSF
jgi:hypothetical protein